MADRLLVTVKAFFVFDFSPYSSIYSSPFPMPDYCTDEHDYRTTKKTAAAIPAVIIFNLKYYADDIINSILFEDRTF